MSKVSIQNPIVLVDADSLVYQLSWYLDQIEAFAENEDCMDAEDYPAIIDKTVDTAIERLMDELGSNNLQLHFTLGEKNKRVAIQRLGYELSSQFRQCLPLPIDTGGYKSNRKSRPVPRMYIPLYASFSRYSYSFYHDKYEADDVIQLLTKTAHKEGKPCIIASNDKDVYKANPVRNFRYDKRKEWTQQTKEFANYFHFEQCITGDPVDGFGGVPGIGPAKVGDWVNVNNTPKENWDGVVAAFKSKGLTMDHAIWTMRMASTHQLVIKNKRIQVDLFNPHIKEHLEPFWK